MSREMEIMWDGGEAEETVRAANQMKMTSRVNVPSEGSGTVIILRETDAPLCRFNRREMNSGDRGVYWHGEGNLHAQTKHNSSRATLSMRTLSDVVWLVWGSYRQWRDILGIVCLFVSQQDVSRMFLWIKLAFNVKDVAGSNKQSLSSTNPLGCTERFSIFKRIVLVLQSTIVWNRSHGFYQPHCCSQKSED